MKYLQSNFKTTMQQKILRFSNATKYFCWKVMSTLRVTTSQLLQNHNNGKDVASPLKALKDH